jgi:hypothetical protein
MFFNFTALNFTIYTVQKIGGLSVMAFTTNPNGDSWPSLVQIGKIRDKWIFDFLYLRKPLNWLIDKLLG